MSIVLAVFTFDEELPELSNNPSKVLDYIGAIEKFSGMDVVCKYQFIKLVIDGLAGYLIHLDGAWLNSSDMHVIYHDALGQLSEMSAPHEKRVQSTFNYIYSLFPLTPGHKTNGYVMSRSDRPERCNIIVHWPTDMTKVAQWIKDNNGVTLIPEVCS